MYTIVSIAETNLQISPCHHAVLLFVLLVYTWAVYAVQHNCSVDCASRCSTTTSSVSMANSVFSMLDFLVS
jgi:hypothetical protein